MALPRYRMTRRRCPSLFRALAGLVALLASLCTPAFALDPGLKVRQLGHTAWTAADGAPSDIVSMGQSADGFLWLGTSAGLYRFDGMRYEAVEVPGKPERSRAVTAILGTPDGGLWLGFAGGGALLLKDGAFRERDEGLPKGVDTNAFVVDRDGHTWAVTDAGLALLEGSRWRVVGAAEGLERGSVRNWLFDVDGNLWMWVQDGWYTLRRGQDKFVKAPAHIASFLDAADGAGNIWEWTRAGDIHGVTPSASVERQPSPCHIDANFGQMSFDAQGSLWVATWGAGLRRIAAPPKAPGQPCAVESFTAKDGLSSDTVQTVFEDREGNLWFGTSHGVDRFRNTRVVSVPLANGPGEAALAAGNDGAVIAANMLHAPVLLTPDGGLTPIEPPGNHQFIVAHRDATGVVWLGSLQGELWSFDGSHSARVPLPPDIQKDPQEAILGLLKDAEGTLWVSFKTHGIYLRRGAAWSKAPNAIVGAGSHATLVAGGGGDLWIADGDAVRQVDGDHARVYDQRDGLQVGHVLTLHVRNGNVWVGGRSGLAVLRGDRFQPVRIEGALPLRTVSGIVERADGSVWINEQGGIAHIESAEVRRTVDSPDHVAAFERLERLDGFVGNAVASVPSPSLIEASDGRLWASTYSGVFWIDPERRYVDTIVPQAVITAVRAGSRDYAPGKDVRLPAGSTQLQVTFTAASLTLPERVRFKYKLAGVDDDWHAGSAFREASYTNLAPGAYRFKVVAATGSGAWSEAGATFDVDVLPAFWQTGWFRVAVAALALGLLWLAHVWRLRLHARQVQARMEARLAERALIARDLHDTLLQGTQVLTWEFRRFAADLPVDDRVRAAMETSLERVDRLLSEGRDSVQGLRSDPARDELSEALLLVAKQFAPTGAPAVEASFAGLPRPLQCEAWLEAYHVAREAIANACRHAEAATLRVQVGYGEQGLSVTVRDDGRGFAPAAERADGCLRHWGLLGMRERASRLGATLAIDSAPGAGTTVTLRIGAARAYTRTTLEPKWSTWIRQGAARLRQALARAGRPPRELT